MAEQIESFFETNLSYLCQIFYLIEVLGAVTVANRYDKEEVNDVQFLILASNRTTKSVTYFSCPAVIVMLI